MDPSNNNNSAVPASPVNHGTDSPNQAATPTFQPTEGIAVPTSPMDNGLGTPSSGLTPQSSPTGFGNTVPSQPASVIGNDPNLSFPSSDSSGFPSSVAGTSNEVPTSAWPSASDTTPVPSSPVSSLEGGANSSTPSSGGLEANQPLNTPVVGGMTAGNESVPFSPTGSGQAADFSSSSSTNPVVGDQPTAGSPMGLTDSAPTDLSHLVGTLSGGSGDLSASPTAPVPSEQFTVPQTQGPTQVVASGSIGFPKWIILVGVLVLLAVAGSSAYFILGIGKSAQPVVETSSPLEEESPASGSGSFVPAAGNDLVNVEVISPTPAVASPTIAAGTPSATASSALDLLKKRQTK